MDKSTFSILFIIQKGKPNAEGNAPSLREFERWMEAIAASGRLLTQSAIGKAIAYAYSLYPPLLETLMIDNKASALPMKQFQACARRVIEDKDLTRERIATQRTPYLATQRIETLTHIRSRAAQIIDMRIA